MQDVTPGGERQGDRIESGPAQAWSPFRHEAGGSDALALAAVAARPGVLPRPAAMLELLAIFAAILLIDWLWPALDIHDLQPSPYWLPVLLLSAQYGTISGAVAAVAAIAFHFTFATSPEQGVGENEFAYRLRLLSQPILWIAAVLLLGQFRMQQIAAKRDLARLAIDLDEQRTGLADYAQRLRVRCDRLEREIAGRPHGEGRALLAAVGELASVSGTQRSIREISVAISRVVAVAYPQATVTLFVLRDGGFIRFTGSGPLPDNGFLDTIPKEHPLAAAILGQRISLCILRESDEAVLGSQGLAAVPVFDREGEVAGLLKIEQAPSYYIRDGIDLELTGLAQSIGRHLPASDLALGSGA